MKIKIKKIYCILFIFLYFINTKNLYSNIENKIIVKVDQNIITSFDLQNEIKEFFFLNNIEFNRKNIIESKDRILKSLINRSIKINEIKKYKVDRYNQYDFSKFIDNTAKSKNMTVGELKKKFELSGLNFSSFTEKIKTEFLWNSLIFDLFSNQVIVSTGDIEAEYQKIIINKRESKQYNLSEIILNNEKNLDINKILKYINDNGFTEGVIKFSSGASTINKGRIGWVKDYQLNNNYLSELLNKEVGYISKPIKNLDKIVILKINNIKVDANNELNEEKIKKDILNSLKERKLKFFALSHFKQLENSALILFQ